MGKLAGDGVAGAIDDGLGLDGQFTLCGRQPGIDYFSAGALDSDQAAMGLDFQVGFGSRQFCERRRQDPGGHDTDLGAAHGQRHRRIRSQLVENGAKLGRKSGIQQLGTGIGLRVESAEIRMESAAGHPPDFGFRLDQQNLCPGTGGGNGGGDAGGSGAHHQDPALPPLVHGFFSGSAIRSRIRSMIARASSSVSMPSKWVKVTL